MDSGLLFFQEVDEFDITILAEVPLQPLLAEGFEVLDISDVHIPRGSGVDGEGEGGRKRARVLTPTNLQPTIVKGQTLKRSDLVEGHGGSRIYKGDKLWGCR